jgi:Protein of unknown function (DUF2934)
MQTSPQPAANLSQDQIAQIAQNLWQQAGQPKDRDLEFWLTAEQKINSSSQVQSGGRKNGEQRQATSSKELLGNSGKSARREGNKV